jgi:hypothetical protein
MTILSGTGVDAFTAGLERCGRTPHVVNDVVSFTVEAFDGAHAGQAIETGVSIQELQGWPLTPPHWIHLPAEIAFSRTNTQPSPVPGWVSHSRQIQGWGTAAEPAQAWIAHVRAVLGEST